MNSSGLIHTARNERARARTCEHKAIGGEHRRQKRRAVSANIEVSDGPGNPYNGRWQPPAMCLIMLDCVGGDAEGRSNGPRAARVPPLWPTCRGSGRIYSIPPQPVDVHARAGRSAALVAHGVRQKRFSSISPPSSPNSFRGARLNKPKFINVCEDISPWKFLKLVSTPR